MKKARFTESQIVAILKQYDTGKTADSLCREHRISKATLYNWRKKYAGLMPSEMKRLRQLEEENGKLKKYNGMDTQQLRKLKDLEDENKRLKRMFADLSLDHQLLKEVLEKKF